MKRFVALARVSSREQEREGFSLEVQEEALRHYAELQGGQIVRFFRIAETASKSDERKTFKELVRYAKKHCLEIDGLLFYKLDRAARNLYDYVELERLESEYNVPFISVAQPTDSNPAGRMMRRTLANMASFYTEQQSVDVREGLARRVQEGWFIGLAPYGYKNVRKNGRGIVEIHRRNGKTVKRIFELFAFHSLTLDQLAEKLHEEGLIYRDSTHKFPRSSLHNILRDRAYIGEIEHKGNWYPGKHEPLVDRATWDRVQTILGGHVYQSHELTYAGDRIKCGYCGHRITGEVKSKQTKAGPKRYIYYRCTYYNKGDHPRIRIREADFDAQVLAILTKMKIEDEGVQEWFRTVLASKTRDTQLDSLSQRHELQRQESLIVGQQDRLLNMRLAEEIDEATFAAKQTELRDRLSNMKLQLDVLDRSHDEYADLASRIFELSQSLTDKWLTADVLEKRQILEIVFLNCVLDDVTLCPTIRKPFDVLAEGLISKKSRGD
ncbi:recombinase family protein [Crateriforma conspicua]|uniref:recombinase family protein n=1 Tax=Crateriforma conspicua TaxID=2527996 RepID=UPI0011B5E0A6|nr:recombinase family protein [Crateriforma conspicua]